MARLDTEILGVERRVDKAMDLSRLWEDTGALKNAGHCLDATYTSKHTLKCIVLCLQGSERQDNGISVSMYVCMYV